MKKRILVIDDEVRIHRIYRQWLNAVGSSIFDLVEATSADDASQILTRESFDLIILDIRMPKLDGQAFFQILKKQNPKLKIIISSVYPIDRQKKLIPFAQDYYDKADGPFKLLEKITRELCIEN